MRERFMVFLLVLGCCAQDIAGALACFVLAALLWLLGRNVVAHPDPVR